jgi:hypothetical protein
MTAFLNLPAPSTRHSLYIHFNVLAENCVFDKQSPEPIHCALSTNCYAGLEGPLIANLRGQIA